MSQNVEKIYFVEDDFYFIEDLPGRINLPKRSLDNERNGNTLLNSDSLANLVCLPEELTEQLKTQTNPKTLEPNDLVGSIIGFFTNDKREGTQLSLEDQNVPNKFVIGYLLGGNDEGTQFFYENTKGETVQIPENVNFYTFRKLLSPELYDKLELEYSKTYKCKMLLLNRGHLLAECIPTRTQDLLMYIDCRNYNGSVSYTEFSMALDGLKKIIDELQGVNTIFLQDTIKFRNYADEKMYLDKKHEFITYIEMKQIPLVLRSELLMNPETLEELNRKLQEQDNIKVTAEEVKEEKEAK